MSKSGVKKNYFTMLDRELSFQATEAFKTLRTNLMFSLSTKQSKCFAVTSSMMHEGKCIVDLKGEEKKNCNVDDLLRRFNEISIESGN